MYQQLKNEELEKIKNLVGENRFTRGKFKLAIELFDELVLSKEYKEFLTLVSVSITYKKNVSQLLAIVTRRNYQNLE